MKIKKGEVVITISPNDFYRYKLAGWNKVFDPSREQIKRYNEKQKLKRMKGGSKDAE